MARYAPEAERLQNHVTGNAATLIRSLDASRSPLGAPAEWPATLRITIDLMLAWQAQTVLFWGPEFIAFYNDSYATTMGDRHPAALGRPAQEHRSEWWDALHPLLEQVMRQGDRVTVTDRPFQQIRHGEPEQIYVDISFSPVREVDDQVAGVLCVLSETTLRVRAAQALATPEARAVEAASRVALALGAHAVIGSWSWNVPSNLVTVDARLAQALELDAAEAGTGVPIERFFAAMHPDDRPGIEQAMATALSRGGAYRAEHRLHTPDDDGWRWAEASGQVELDPAGCALHFSGVMVDIDARKRAEHALHDTQEELRTAHATGVGVFALDVATHQLTVSEEFCRLFGVPPVLHLPGSMIEALGVGTDGALTAKGNFPLHGSLGLDVEYQVRRPDTGELRWLARRARFVRDATGRPVELRGVVQDITVRKRIEARLLESEGRFRALAEAVPAQVWTARPDGEVDWFNQGMVDYSGLDLDHLIGDGWHCMVHSEDLPHALTQLRNALVAQMPYEMEIRLRRHDGAFLWHLVRARPVYMPTMPAGSETAADTSSLLRWVGTNANIDEQKNTLQELARINLTLGQRVERRTRDRDRIWRLSTDLMVTTELDGSIVSTNPAWFKLLGLSDTGLNGLSMLDLVHPDDVRSTAEQLARLTHDKATVQFENRCLHRNGSDRSVSWTGVRDDQWIHGIGRDVTAERHAATTLRETEARLRQSQKMEAIGQLTGGIAHDFNNLLQGITGAIEVTRRRVALGRTDDLDRFMVSASQSAHRAGSLIQRLLAFSRHQSLDSKALDVNALIRSMEDLLRRTLGEHIGLTVSLDAPLQSALGDENQFETAILNLAINARDAMPKGGELNIATHNATLDQAYVERHEGLVPGDYVSISVTDTGAGMAPEVLAKAFEPFFTTKQIGQGSGLGLSMVYGFAKQLGGHARIDSRPGHGTTVTLYLPRLDVAVPALVLPVAPTLPPPSELPPGQGEVVLVVEDDPGVRLLVMDVLSDLGYQPLEARDGNSAVATLQSETPIDLLVSDIGLPGLNGRQVAEIARRQRPELRVLFMTGYAEHAALRSEFAAPGVQLIVKPFAIDDFARTVAQMVHAD